MDPARNEIIVHSWWWGHSPLGKPIQSSRSCNRGEHRVPVDPLLGRSPPGQPSSSVCDRTNRCSHQLSQEYMSRWPSLPDRNAVVVREKPVTQGVSVHRKDHTQSESVQPASQRQNVALAGRGIWCHRHILPSKGREGSLGPGKSRKASTSLREWVAPPHDGGSAHGEGKLFLIVGCMQIDCVKAREDTLKTTSYRTSHVLKSTSWAENYIFN